MDPQDPETPQGTLWTPRGPFRGLLCLFLARFLACFWPVSGLFLASFWPVSGLFLPVSGLFMARLWPGVGMILAYFWSAWDGPGWLG